MLARVPTPTALVHDDGTSGLKTGVPDATRAVHCRRWAGNSWARVSLPTWLVKKKKKKKKFIVEEVHVNTWQAPLLSMR